MPIKVRRWDLPDSAEYLDWKLPMVEIFETVEGEGGGAGFPTVFVRAFHCNLRCKWCDTPYSYAPAKPEFEASITEIVEKVDAYASRRICFTGGEPLIHREKSAALIAAMADLDKIVDIHIETNGAIDLEPFAAMREENEHLAKKMRFVMDYKLPDSGEMDKMIDSNFDFLESQDEVKFVIGSEEDFRIATDVVKRCHNKGTVLFSPVWETMEPSRLVEKLLQEPLPDVKISMQLHKIIWDPNQRGV
ncbi:MAG TPA: radical SAM protein, partial [Bacillales bacterium]|nr:radical SAM protein [Bacillales bacterium]